MQNNARHTLASFNLTTSTILKTLFLLLLLAGQASQALAQQQCPTLTVSCPRNAIGGTITFTASPAIGGLTYEWTVDAGTIASGQGTPVIRVIDVLGSVKAEVKNAGCFNVASCVSSIAPVIRPRNLDAFVFIATDDAKARLDNLAIQLQNEPGATGYIIVRGNERASANTARFAMDYLINSRGIDNQRVEAVTTSEGMATFEGAKKVEGAKKAAGTANFIDRPRIEIWIVPAGVEPPQVENGIKPSPAPMPASPRSRTRNRGHHRRRLH